ncbi:MAG: hypothetical protein HY332_25955 [Chloroflexi bacterium]|nr:hypothetical protein [Chloroflexota bacterium]
MAHRAQEGAGGLPLCDALDWAVEPPEATSALDDAQLRRERDHLGLILRSVPHPILVVDGSNRVVRSNELATQLFHMPEPTTAHEAAGSASLRNRALLAAFLGDLWRERTQEKSGELALFDPESERTVAMWVTAKEMRDERGAVSGIVVVLQDLTPLRELEQRRVEQSLFESEKLAALGRLAAQIAHEINNPLEAIKNSLYLLVSRLPPENANYRFLKIAQSETERVSSILRQMLGFYRPVTSMAAVDVNTLIADTIALVRKRFEQQGVPLVTKFGATLPPVVASADQLKQVLLNVLINAQQAMPDGGTIAISSSATGASAEPGDQAAQATQATQATQAAQTVRAVQAVQIQIEDTGSGIPDDVITHVFEPFFSTKAQKGTGLGLWVSATIVRAHGGNIQVRSRPGHTTFTISLPIGGPPTHD